MATRTPVMAKDKTGQTISGAYIENGKTYFGNGTPISAGTTVVDNSGREWIKGNGASGGTLTGVNYGIGKGNTRDLGGGTSANDYYQRMLEQQRKAAEEAQRIRTQSTIDSINSNIPRVNQDYENQQTQNYITHTKNMFGMGDFLRSQGYSGGMSETELGKQKVNYETARNTANQNKNNALDYYAGLVAQAQATGDQELANIATNYYNEYAAYLKQQEMQGLQARQRSEDMAIDERRYQDSLTQQQFNNDLATKEYQLAVQRAKAAGTSGTSGLTAGQSLSAIQAAYSSGDMTYSEYMNAISQLGVKVNTQDNASAVDYTKVTQIINGLGNYMAGRGTNQAAVTHVQQLLDKGSINQAEYNYILNKFGYRM